jgi:hypothetical protein
MIPDKKKGASEGALGDLNAYRKTLEVDQISRVRARQERDTALMSGVERVKHVAFDNQVNHGLPSHVTGLSRATHDTKKGACQRRP